MDFKKLMDYVEQHKAEHYQKELAAHKEALEQARKASAGKQTS